MLAVKDLNIEIKNRQGRKINSIVPYDITAPIIKKKRKLNNGLLPGLKNDNMKLKIRGSGNGANITPFQENFIL